MKIIIEGVDMYVSYNNDIMEKLLYAMAHMYFYQYDLDKQIDQCIDYIGIKMMGGKNNVLTPFYKN